MRETGLSTGRPGADAAPLTAEALTAALAERERELAEARRELAALAAEKTRLSGQVQEALERETATSEILRIISRSPTDAAPVFNHLVTVAARLLACDSAFVILSDGKEWRPVAGATHGAAPADILPDAYPVDETADFPSRVIASAAILHLPDWSSVPVPPIERRVQEITGAQSSLYLPFLRDGGCVGLLAFTSRCAHAFGDTAIAQAEAFRDQAMIAMENARLFGEVRAKTRDLEESLAQQTATAHVLKVISRSVFDLQEVLDTLIASAVALIGAHHGTLCLRDGDVYRYRSHSSLPPDLVGWLNDHPPRADASSATGRVILAGAVVEIADVTADPDYVVPSNAFNRTRSILGAPLLRNGAVEGVLIIARTEPGRFSTRQIEVAKTFADQAMIAIENARLFGEVQAKTRDLEESLAQQTATADVLKVISRSVFDLDPVLRTLVGSARRLCDASIASISIIEDGFLRFRALDGGDPAFAAFLRDHPFPVADPNPANNAGRVLLTGAESYIPDVTAAPDYAFGEAPRLGGFRSLLGTPLLRDGKVIGVFQVGAAEPDALTPRQIALMRTFADQAVVAIENARLFDEVQEALQRETATSEILRVISRSPTDARPVFDTIVLAAVRLLGCDFAFVFLRDGGAYVHASGATQQGLMQELPGRTPLDADANFPSRAMLAGEALHLPDWSQIDLPEHERAIRAAIGVNSTLYLPLLRGGDCIGVLGVGASRPNSFGPKEIALADSFRDQAMIAMENARLFNEVQAKTRDLEETLAQQTATADVLKVISRSAFDLDVVLATLTESARTLCGADIATVHMRDGRLMRLRAESACPPEFVAFLSENPIDPATRRGARTHVGAAALSGAPAAIPDIEAETDFRLGEAPRLGDFRSVVGVPMLRDGRAEGVFSLARRAPGAFSTRQIEVLQTFADQAVIAIENARLFEQVQAKTRDLEETLAQQTATAEVLKVISRSPANLQPVLDAIADTAARLCGSDMTMFFRFDGRAFRILSSWNFPDDVRALLEAKAPEPGHPSALGRAGATLRPAYISDVLADPDYGLKTEQNRARYRATLAAPMLREGKLVGALSLNRAEPGSFTPKHIELVSTFADQAAIAFENVRLFNETQARTRDVEEALEDQIATSGVLQAIGASMADAQPVFERIVDSLAGLMPHDLIGVWLTPGDGVMRIAAHRAARPFDFEGIFPAPVGQTALAFADDAEQQYELSDVLGAPAAPTTMRELAERHGNFAVLITRMVWRGRLVGTLGVTRAPGATFAARERKLLRTFADQAVIAIENARLFGEVQTRTRDLERSLERQTATAEILNVIASSPADVQPVFEAIVTSAKRLLGGADSLVLARIIGDEAHIAAFTPSDPELDAARLASFPRSSADDPIVRELLACRSVLIDDTETDTAFQTLREHAREEGWRSLIVVPLVSRGKALGGLSVARAAPGGLAADDLELLETFADQAVIAIENARLLNDIRESLAQQTATADVLKTISRSVFDLQAVLDTLLKSAVALVGERTGMMFLKRDDAFVLQAEDTSAESGFVEAMKTRLLRAGRGSAVERVILTGEVQNIADIRAEPEWDPNLQALTVNRSLLGVPMKRGEELIGVIVLARPKPGAWSSRQVELVQTFADQAVIAIENARLFEEVQAKTRDLEESLAQQTATADVLKVISRSAFDLQGVFDALVGSAVDLMGAVGGSICLRRGEAFVFQSVVSVSPEIRSLLGRVLPVNRETAPGRALGSGQLELIADAALDPDFRAPVRGFPIGSALATPLVREGRIEGVMSVIHAEPNGFDERQIRLLQTFADQAVIAIGNTRLLDEVRTRTQDLEESLERQRATSAILEVIASSPADASPVFEAISARANAVMRGRSTGVYRFIGEEAHLMAMTSTSPEGDAALRAVFPLPLADFPLFQRFSDGFSQILDTEAADDPRIRDLGRARGYRSILLAPLLQQGRPTGLISVTRAEVGGFAPADVAQLRAFADQAVIAIENARLFNEVQAKTRDLEESLAQQTATADVLKVISRSAFDLQVVFDTLIASAIELVGGVDGTIFVRDGESVSARAHKGVSPEWANLLAATPPTPGRRSAAGRVLLSGRTESIPDVLADPDYAMPVYALNRSRSLLATPMLREDRIEGVLVVGRAQPGPFTQRQVELVQSFADQAVIAIENVRLFDEVQAKTRDLEESLAQQTATADVLKVIGRSAFDRDSVLQTLIDNAVRLARGSRGAIHLRDGDALVASGFTSNVPADLRKYLASTRWPLDADMPFCQAAREQRIVHIPDFTALEDQLTQEVRKHAPYGAGLWVPLMGEAGAVGVFGVPRNDPGAFTDREIEVVQTFADQAVIAIENARLFNEVQAKTRDLEESLAQQTATADVLKVISRSAFDLDPVFSTLIERAAGLCGANRGTIFLREGDALVPAALHGMPEGTREALVANPLRVDESSAGGRAVLSRDVCLIPDITADPAYRRQDLASVGQYRSIIGVPLIQDGEAIGAFSLPRAEPGGFTPRQIETLKTFADQAVIAIGNARLFNEVQEKTRDLEESLAQQTATADVLKVISRSVFDLDSVLQTLIDTAVRLARGSRGTIFLRRGEALVASAFHSNVPDELRAYLSSTVWPLDGDNPQSTAVREERIVHIADITNLADETTREVRRRAPYGAGLWVPLIGERGAIGVFGVPRDEPVAFSDREIEIVKTFADQALIAIENARLFNEVQARTKELAQSLDDLRRAQDRLIQSEKLASLGQLTAGIAHEIKNPLNFVNNFSALSRELTEELREVLDKAALAGEAREEADELLGMIDQNLDKVVAHGKRADSIVKNMLLHSREGSGERGPVAVNGLVEEALNLAYHGARAEKPGFNVTIEKALDPAGGEAELYPQEMTRVLLNLISNGFYATTKRGQGGAPSGWEPTIFASTRDLGHSVEIVVRDNGTGIPDDVKARMFNPFFTTKPAGEGTGLGLSLSHDIVVKQHGGTIEVETEPGAFAAFTITLPRRGPGR